MKNLPFLYFVTYNVIENGHHTLNHFLLKTDSYLQAIDRVKEIIEEENNGYEDESGEPRFLHDYLTQTMEFHDVEYADKSEYEVLKKFLPIRIYE